MLTNNPLKQKFFGTHKKIQVEDTKLIEAKKTPIESLYIGAHLKKTGRVLMGRCPFHKDDTASLAIYTETNTFNCFGCHASGDAIKFYMLLHGQSFQAALEELSQ